MEHFDAARQRDNLVKLSRYHWWADPESGTHWDKGPVVAPAQEGAASSRQEEQQ